MCISEIITFIGQEYNMFKNYFKKFFVVAISVLLVLPFINLKTNLANAKALYDLEETIMLATDYSLEIDKDGVKEIPYSDVVITANFEDNGAVNIFENGSDVANDNYVVSYTAGSTDKNAKLTVRVNKDLGMHELIVKSSDASVTQTYRIKFTVTNDFDDLRLAYKLDNDKLNEYEQKVLEATKKNDEQLRAGEDSFTVPSVESLIDSNMPYGSIKKTAYYCGNGSSSYSSTSTFSTLSVSFSINSYGTYRFYVLMQIPYTDMQGEHYKEISIKGLKELNDGFYKCYDTNGDELYYSNEKFYTDETCNEESTLSEDESLRELIVPIFEFTLDDLGPNIVISSSYQENGYLGSKYTVSSVSVYGNDVQTTYTLEYAKDGNAEFATAEEELDTGSLTFTPSKKGLYRVKVSVYDAGGNSKTAYTRNIEVKENFISVKYVTSFKDWLSVNTLPFILLCISGACLIAIVLLLVIKPKDKAVVLEEEDK